MIRRTSPLDPTAACGSPISANNSIGRIKTDGVVSNYTGSGIESPMDITAGPDGNLWFTNSGADSVGRISTKGVVTNYNGAGIKNPWGIATGSDGAVWFTNFGNNSVGRITVPKAS